MAKKMVKKNSVVICDTGEIALLFHTPVPGIPLEVVILLITYGIKPISDATSQWLGMRGDEHLLAVVLKKLGTCPSALAEFEQAARELRQESQAKVK